MSQTTKRALEASFKKLLLEKPLNKITINDITEDCGVNRMTFYYHFKDIYDLVEWACVEDGKRALQDKKTYDTWLEGIEQIFEAVLENKPFIMNVYHAIAREKVEQYLYKLTYELIVHVVEEKCKDVEIADEDKSFIADFYKYGFVGIMLYITFWIYVFKKALIFFQHTKQAKLMIIVLLLICFFGIEGTSDSTITTHRGLFMMMMIGLMLSEMKNKIANSKS